jgi:hypothetical protein
MSDDLSEETITNGDLNNAKIDNGVVMRSSTPKKPNTNWRISQVVKGGETLEGAADPDPPWWSDEDDDEKTDRSAPLSISTSDNNTKTSNGHTEEGFESFSCTDEEDEGDQTSLDSTTTSRYSS